MEFNEYIFAKFMESFVYTAYLFFIFLAIQIFFLWKNVRTNVIELIMAESFVRKNCLYALILSMFVIVFNLFENAKYLDESFGMFKILAAAILVLFSFEWYLKLRPKVTKLLPEELTDLNSHFFHDKQQKH